MLLIGKTSYGLDISDRSIEAARLDKLGNNMNVTSLGRSVLVPGIVERGRIKDRAKLKEAVWALLENAKPDPMDPKEAVVSLPDDMFYVHIFETKSASGDITDAEASMEMRNVIPVDHNSLACAHREFFLSGAGSSKPRSMSVLIAAEKDKLREWQEFFNELGITAKAFDIGSLAARRVYFIEEKVKDFMTADIGALTTKISVFSQNRLAYHYSFPFGGESLDAAVAEAVHDDNGVKISLDTAEKIKLESGLLENQKNPEASQAMKNALARLEKEIGAAKGYFREKTGKEIADIILCGGSSSLRGLEEHLSGRLGGGDNVRVYQPLPVGEGSEFYMEAIGASLGDLERRWHEIDPILDNGKNHCSDGPYGHGKKPEENIFSRTHDRGIAARAGIFIVLSLFFVMAFVLGGESQKKNYGGSFFGSPKTETTPGFSLDMKIPFSVSQKDTPSDGVAGKLLYQSVHKVQEYEKAKSQSKAQAEALLLAGEALWKEPVHTPGNNGQLIFPLEFIWLAYSRSALAGHVLEQAKIRLSGQKGLSIRSLDWEKMEASPNESGRYYLYGKVNVSFSGDGQSD